MRFRSLRSQLAWTYAGLGLLTAVILGAILVTVLGSYYARAETAYLTAAAERAMRTPPRSTDASGYASWAKFTALDTQTRVRLVRADGTVITDSGSPDRIDPRTLAPAGSHTAESGPAAPPPGRLPGPLGGGIFGASAGSPRSNVTLSVPVSGNGLPSGTSLVLSEGPASGADVLLGVSEAWLVAAILAVALSAVAGWLVAGRIAKPIDVLTEASDRMAEGDLGTRADIHRDDEVGRLADSFNAMAQRTETTVTTLRRFVGDAAHEIGTPLTALQADLELAESGPVASDEKRLIGRALAAARRLEELSTNLLRLSRIEAADHQPELTEVDLGDIAHQAADALASRAEAADLDFVLEIAQGPLPVLADRAELQTAVDNVLDNAVKFTPKGGTVTLGTSRTDDRAVLWVRDSGVGVPQPERAEVFERFHRARNVADYRGSGLGLAIVRATVERLGGTVTLSSGGGPASAPGTLVEIDLPTERPVS